MENKMTSEWMEKVTVAKSPDELLTLAKENSVELTAEQAAAYYAKLHPQGGELTDEELDNVAGGGCGSKTILICPSCQSEDITFHDDIFIPVPDSYGTFSKAYKCNQCGSEFITPWAGKK